MCRLFEVSRSGYYAWLKRPPSARWHEDIRLTEQIREIHRDSGQSYGTPRVVRALRLEGYRVGRRRAGRLMRRAGLTVKGKRRFVLTTDSNHSRPIAPHLLRRSFWPNRPNKAWAADITYIPTKEGWLYLAVVLDLFSRKVVGWETSDRMKSTLVTGALQKALDRRAPKRGLIHHSDRGSQYASELFREVLSQHFIRASMSRRRNCWDNSVVESFFATLKTERVHHDDYKTREEARVALFGYIEGFYNRRRMHSSLGYVSPAQYEEAVKSKDAA